MSQSIPPLLSVHPTRALIDEKFTVLVENLPHAAPVTLHALHHSEDGDYWEAYGHYFSDHRGVVNVAEDLSFGGTYVGKEQMGLLWSMRPEPGSRTGLRLRKLEVTSPMLVHISVYGGHITEGFRRQPPLASGLTERWYMAPGVKRIEIKDRGVRGTLFIPPGPGPFPGLLDMWGGGGGLLEYRSALLASHGYVSLALEYFSPGELKTAGLRQQYFEPHCCVCISGHHLVPTGDEQASFADPMESAARRGLAVIFAEAKTRFDDNNYRIWRDMNLPIPSDPAKKLNVTKIKCPMLVIVGGDDQNIPAEEAAEDLAQMMESGGNRHLLSKFVYPDTGHLIEPPYSPHFRASNFIVPTRKEKSDSSVGRTNQASLRRSGRLLEEDFIFSTTSPALQLITCAPESQDVNNGTKSHSVTQSCIL